MLPVLQALASTSQHGGGCRMRLCRQQRSVVRLHAVMPVTSELTDLMQNFNSSGRHVAARGRPPNQPWVAIWHPLPLKPRVKLTRPVKQCTKCRIRAGALHYDETNASQPQRLDRLPLHPASVPSTDLAVHDVRKAPKQA